MAKQVKKRPKKAATANARVRKLTKKQVKAKAKKTVKARKSLPGSFKLTVQVGRILWQHWKTLGGIVLVYLILNVVFASGISNVSASFSTIKTNLDASGGRGLANAAGGFASLIGSSGSSGSSTGSTLQGSLVIIESLVVIWALRHLLSGQQIKVKQAYYSAMTPLVPFLLVLAMIFVQLLPISIGALALAAIINSVITAVGLATAASAVIFGLLAAWSVYMVSASIFAVYIVTLPEMQPRQALRSAKDLVKFRRLLVIRKLLFLPVLVLLFMSLIIVPLILFVSFLVPAVFFLLSMLAILFVHTYLYSLYRSLIE